MVLGISHKIIFLAFYLESNTKLMIQQKNIYTKLMQAQLVNKSFWTAYFKKIITVSKNLKISHKTCKNF